MTSVNSVTTSNFEEFKESQFVASTVPVIDVGSTLKVKVVSYHAFGFIVSIQSPLPSFLKEKTALIHRDVLAKHFPGTTCYSDFIKNDDELEACIHLLPSETQKQIYLNLSRSAISLLQERRQKSLMDSTSII